MNYETHQLLIALAHGYYLRHRTNHDGKEGYMLYKPKPKASPERFCKSNHVKPLLYVLKKTSDGVYTLCRKQVLKLHGNNAVKKEYKKIRAVVKNHSKELGS